MEGFIRCNQISRNLCVHDNSYLCTSHDEFDKYKKWDLMRKAGIWPYPEYDFYVSNVYGAWMGNIDYSIRNTNDLLDKYQFDLDQGIETPFVEFIKKGYELIIGPGVPETDGKIHGNGVYCKNWLELLENKMSASKIKTIRK